MAQQQRLEKVGLDYRQNNLGKTNSQLPSNGAYTKTNKYDENHKDALADGDALGKGTGMPMGYAVADYNAPRTQMNYSVIDTTTNAGGLYDTDGRNGMGGRKRLMTINRFNENNPYGENSVDTSANIADGQYKVH